MKSRESRVWPEFYLKLNLYLDRSAVSEKIS